MISAGWICDNLISSFDGLDTISVNSSYTISPAAGCTACGWSNSMRKDGEEWVGVAYHYAQSDLLVLAACTICSLNTADTQQVESLVFLNLRQWLCPNSTAVW